MPGPNAEATRNLLFIRTLPTSETELKAAITQALLFSSSSAANVKSLDIAVTLPSQDDKLSRRQSFYKVEKILNKVYSLAEGDDIDVNVILLHENYNACGGLIRHWSDLRRMSEVGQWEYILSIEDADNLFGPNCKNAITLQLEESDGIREQWWERGVSDQVVSEGEEHDISCVGGTFDYLHAGHKLLLTMTAYMIPSKSSSPKIIVGLTGSELLKNKKHKEYVTSWETRRDSTVSFLRTVMGDSNATKSGDTEMEVNSDLPTSTRIKKYHINSPSGLPITLEIHEIQDAFGPTITMEEVSCLVVSDETKAGGKAVNDKRKEKGWKELEVFIVGLVGGDGSVEGKLSSTEMRRRRAEQGNILKNFVS